MRFVVVYTESAVFTNILTHECILDQQSLSVCEVSDTVEPPKRGQCGDEPFVLSREVVLFQRFLFLSLKMKHSSCLDTYTKRIQSSHESVESCERGYHAYCRRMVSC